MQSPIPLVDDIQYDCDMPGVPNVCGMAASIDIDLHLELTH